MKHKLIQYYKFMLKKFVCQKQILFILFLKDETDIDFIISLFNEFHILTDLLLIICVIVLS